MLFSSIKDFHRFLLKPLLLLLLLQSNVVSFSRNKQSVNASDSIPIIGQQLPAFTLNQVEYFGKSAISETDLQGKWSILDFWYRGCVSCIKSFPKMNAIYEELKDSLNVVLVGLNRQRSFGAGIRDLYERLRIKQHLSFPVAYDSVLAVTWDIPDYPHLVITDPKGTVVAITAGHYLTVEKLRQLMQGKQVNLNNKKDNLIPFKGAKASEAAILYRSQLSEWQEERQSISPPANPFQENSKRYHRVSMAPLLWLYKLACLGNAVWLDTDPLYSTTYPLPIIEATNKKIFVYDFEEETGLYNYEYTSADTGIIEDKIVMRNLMLTLQSIFKCSATVEKRNVKVWKLIALPGASKLLKSKGGAHYEDVGADGGAGGFEYRNYSISFLVTLLRHALGNGDIPIFDETGIDFPIDIKMDCVMADREQVKKALRRYGLDLVMGDRLMDCVVIRDL